MFLPRTKLKVPLDFGFPYETIYDIQLQLMQSLFTVIEEKKIGIFESPTGTGKSLTLTCAALCWLEQHEALVRQELHDRILEVKRELIKLEAESERSKEWLTIKHIVIEQRDELKSLQRLQDLLEIHEKRLIELRQNSKKKVQTPFQEIPDKKDESSSLTEVEELFVDQQESGSSDVEDSSNDIKNQCYHGVQIFFCSRTHSQLAQVLREVKQTRYGKHIRCISLASRQQFCINPQVRSMSNVASMNECCLDMTHTKKTMTTSTTSDVSLLKNRTPSVTKCPYRNVTTVQDLSESMLCDIQDIEEIVGKAQKAKACAYYASRTAAQSAQLIMLPYQLLLHRRTRLQSGIDLRGAVVIIDEAHNLLDTIAQLYSCKLTLQQLNSLQHQIETYKQQYAVRFSTSNLLRINQLLFITKRLIDILQQSVKHKQVNSRILRTYELTTEGEFYNIDLLQLLEFCERTRFAQKLQGHAQSVNIKSKTIQKIPARKNNTGTVNLLQQLQQDQERKKRIKVDVSSRSDSLPEANLSNVQEVVSVRCLLAFLEALTENADDGRVLICPDFELATSSSFKYLLLNPGSRFEDILREARAIVIAGGTLQPTNELMHQLFHTCPERVTQHFYDHVVAPDAVLPLIVTCGPTGQRLCFNYAKRNSEEMMSELCRCLLNFCSVIPSGVVCFLPSYEYLDIVYVHLEKSGILARLLSKKRVFCESKNLQNVEKLLVDYAETIKSNNGGALLLSVVGGKLSEGLNFADDLGRGVIVVGLPYPNRQSVELLERLKYLDSVLGNDAGNEYYENLCMKAVNQCIGRSVRHIADYACVCLLDERYATTERIRNKLPKWILRSLKPLTLEQNFGYLQASIAKFFKQKIV